MTNCLHLLGVLCLAAPAQGDVIIVTAERGTISASSFGIASAGGAPTLTYSDASGATAELPCEEIDQIQVANARPPVSGSPGLVEIELTSGDRFLGTLRSGDESRILIMSASLGEIETVFERVRAIRSVANAPLVQPRPAGESEDFILTRSGERGRGILKSVTEKGVLYESTILQQDVRVPLEEFVAVYPLEIDAPPRPPDTLYAVAVLKDSSQFVGTVEGASEGRMLLRSLYGEERKLDISRLASVFFKNGKVVYLSDLSPARVDENANCIRVDEPLPSDLEIPWKGDASAAGGPIQFGGTTHRKGIGVHAYSSLTYDLSAGRFRRFQCAAGLDDCGRGLGNVVFRVLLDGETAFERALDAEQNPVEVSIPLEGVRELTLIVDFGQRANQGDYADWASARLIR